jgi:hypothetical protein
MDLYVSKELYDRSAAVAYAHKWAYSRNPAYYNYDKLGGDCTNFASHACSRVPRDELHADLRLVLQKRKR